MAASARSWIVRRRAANVADLSNLRADTPGITFDELNRKGTLGLNSKIDVGIATETEVGLGEERFPIFCRIVADQAPDPPRAVDTVSHYWRVVDATGAAVPFSRRPDFNPLVLSRLYEWVNDFDDLMFDHIEFLKGIQPPVAPVWNYQQVYEINMNAWYANASVVVPSPVQVQAAVDSFRELMDSFVINNSYPYFKIADNRYLHAVPHGNVRASPDPVLLPVDQMLTKEWLLTMQVNAHIMRLRYPNAPDGIITAAAYSIAQSNRFGFYESFEHKEFGIMYMSVKNNGDLEVQKVIKPDALTLPAEYDVGRVVDISNTRAHHQMLEVANGLNVTAGIMHYSYNHTTGGNVLSGALLSMTMLYNLFDMENRVFVPEMQTSVYYEALHNVNKRMVANLFLSKTKVHTYGRARMCYPLQQVKADTFMNIRKNAYPAGSHKAYICLIVLKRVMASMHGAFLPWVAELNNCIQICQNVMLSGARAHVGSGYYTGLPSIAQGAELDAYLPELAAYMMTMAKNDTLTMSPHLGPDIAARANQSWVAMLNKVKSEDISATDPKIVKEFLEQSGQVTLTFDPADNTTWAAAAQECTLAAKQIDNILAAL